MSTHPSLSAIVQGVYSRIPEHTNYPYIHINIQEITPLYVSEIFACEAICQITSFSQAHSPAELYLITEHAYEALVTSTHVYAGITLINTTLAHCEFDMLQDGFTHVSNLTMRLVFEEVA